MRRQKNQRNALVPLFLLAAVLSIVGLVVGLAIGLQPTARTAETLPTTTPVPEPSCFIDNFNCPTEKKVVATNIGPKTDDSQGKCIAYRPDMDLFYIFIFNPQSGYHYMYTWSEGSGLSSNILAGGAFPGDPVTNVLTGCVFYPPTGKLLIVANNRLISIEPTDGQATELGWMSSVPGLIRSLALFQDDRLLVNNAGPNIYEVDPSNGALIQTFSNAGPPNTGSISYVTKDYSTNRTVIAMYYEVFLYSRFIELYNIDLNTGDFFPACTSFRFEENLGFEFDSIGRLYFLNHYWNKLYRLNTSPMYPFVSGKTVNSTGGANFTVTCPAPYIGSLLTNTSDVPAPTVDDIGCDGLPATLINSHIIDLVRTDNPGQLSKKKKKRNVNTVSGMAISNATATMYNISVTPLCLLANETYNVTAITEEEEEGAKRSLYAFPGPLSEFKRSGMTISSVGGNTSTVFPTMIANSANKGVMIIKDPNNPNLLAFDTGGMMFTVDSLAMAPCDGNPSKDYSIRYDVEVNRWVIVWIVQPSHVCFLFSDTADHLGTYTFTAFDFIGQDIRDLQFSIWGDYYTTTWNDVNLVGAAGDSVCNVFERARFLDATGPRSMQLPAPSVVSIDGERATSAPLHQPPNNGPRAPVQLAYPCGVFVAMTASSGGVLNMRLCESVDFDTMMITSSDSRTIIGTYNNGANGTCASETSCAACGPVPKNPLRYQVAAAYRSFPSKSYEKLAVAITVDSDGSSREKIRWGEFIMQTDGTLSPVDAMAILDDAADTSQTTFNLITKSPQPVFAPALLYDVTEMLFMAYWKIEELNQVSVYPRHRYRLPSTPPGLLHDEEPLYGIYSCATETAFPVGIASVVNTTGMFSSAEKTISGTPHRVIIGQYVYKNQTIVLRNYAVDTCCNLAWCEQTIELGWSGFVIPQP